MKPRSNGQATAVAQCRFRDCTNPACRPYVFCEFHAGTPDGAAQTTLGSMRAVERTLKQQPDHSDPKRYGLALADVLTKWFGDESKLVAAECVRVLEGMR